MSYAGSNKKRIPLTEKKQVIKSGIINSAKAGTIEVPSDVKKVLMEHLEGDMTDEEPDEQMLEVLEDIYVKAGEIGNLNEFTRMTNWYKGLKSVGGTLSAVDLGSYSADCWWSLLVQMLGSLGHA